VRNSLHFLAQVEAEELRDVATPARLLAAGSRAYADEAFVVVNGDDQPSATTEQECAHLIDEAIDEGLFEAAEIAFGFGLTL
jgi:hypothetical protein